MTGFATVALLLLLGYEICCEIEKRKLMEGQERVIKYCNEVIKSQYDLILLLERRLEESEENGQTE